MSFAIHPASRQGVKPLVGLYGKSGSGKTMSALLLARGLVGPTGKVTLIDSESGRGSIFADLIPGGYSVLDLDAPFSPDRYQEAIVEAESQSDAVVVDSMSHEWSGEGGVLDWADAELEKMGGEDRNKLRSWIKPKMSHKMMVQRLLRCKVPLICCLRGEEKTHTGKDARGKTTVITDEFSSPLFDPRFIYELLLNFETVARDGKGGFVIPRKITHPSILPLLPGESEQIGVKHGERLAQWCASPGGSSQPVANEADAIKRRIWIAASEIHGCTGAKLDADSRELGKQRLAQWLLDEGIIADTETIEGLGLKRLREVLAATAQRLTPSA